MFFTHDSELSSQASRGDPVPIQNLVRQATINLAGQDAGEGSGEDGGGQRGLVECAKATAIIVIVFVVIILCWALLKIL